MTFLLLGIIIIIQGYSTDACLPRKTRELTDSYLPIGIQALDHYISQLQMYYPYTNTRICETGTKIGDPTVAIPQSDMCVVESVARMNLLLVDLQREAAEQNLEHSQGFTRSVLTDIKRISQMTAAQQFHFILNKLHEEIKFRKTKCLISEFLLDLENPNSNLFRNFFYVKPISYLIRK